MLSKNNYILTIGLEIHVQLLTQSKMFSREATSYGQPPNTHTSPITLAHPGTMPSLNKKAIEHTIKIGLACHANITKHTQFARKNYFYFDSSKGYQITQDKTPLCTKGYILINTPEEKKIRIIRIHLEEDTAKSIHNRLPGNTLIDFNRAGTPLVEIVTEPDITSAEEAYQFLAEIRRLVRYLGISDGDMEKGSLRCDANVSVRKEGTEALGQKVEIKNMNSMGHVKKAIMYEKQRQIGILEQGGSIEASTRSYDAELGVTVHQRSKETLSQYRYFPEPDLSPLVVEPAWIDSIKSQMPPLPRELAKKFIHVYGLSSYDTNVLIENKGISLFFEATCQHTKHYKAVANWIMGPVKSYLNQEKITIDFFPINPLSLARLIDMVAEESLSFSVAATKLLPLLVETPKENPYKLAEVKGLLQKTNKEDLTGWIQAVLAKYPDKVEAYKQGKKGLIGFFMGEVMKLSKGKANPKEAMLVLKKFI